MYDPIKAAIKAAGYPCYDPSTNIVEVKAAYAVVHDNGTQPQPGTKGMLGYQIFEIVCLVPTDKQSLLPTMLDAVKLALKALPNLKYTGDTAPTGVEATFSAASMSMIYQLPRRLQ